MNIENDLISISISISFSFSLKQKGDSPFMNGEYLNATYIWLIMQMSIQYLLNDL